MIFLPGQTIRSIATKVRLVQDHRVVQNKCFPQKATSRIIVARFRTTLWVYVTRPAVTETKSCTNITILLPATVSGQRCIFLLLQKKVFLFHHGTGLGLCPCRKSEMA